MKTKTRTREEKKIIRVDQSRLKAAKFCSVQDFFRYHLQLETKSSPRPDSPFVQGSILHAGMESLYSKKTWLDLEAAKHFMKGEWDTYCAKDEFFDANAVGWYALLVDVVECLERYFDHYSNNDSNELAPISQEVPFEIEIYEDEDYIVVFHGKFDGLVRHKLEKIILLKEYKFYAQIVWEQLLEIVRRDFQCGSYNMAAQAYYGEKFGGILYRVTRKKDSKTLPNYFEERVSRTPNECMTLARYIAFQAIEMQKRIDKGPMYLIPLLDDTPIPFANKCQACEFDKDLCKAFRTGEDWQAIAKLNYRPKEKYAEFNKGIVDES